MAVTITKPASGATLTGLATVEATYSGQNFNTATVSIDGQQLATDSAKPLSFSIDTARVPDGLHTLTVAVRYRTNGGALRWQKASIPITTEGNDMEVILSTDKDTSNLAGTVVVTATVTPPGHKTPLTDCKFYVDNVLQATDTSYPLTFSWDTTLVVDGDHVLKATVVAKRTKTSTPLPVKVKNTVTPPPPPPVEDPPVNTALPTISGTATEGQTLIVSPGTWTNDPTSFSRQWMRCDAAGANGVAIPGAINQNYVLVSADVDATIRCVVIASNEVGPSAAVQTAQTAVVAALAPAVPVNVALPVISGSPVVGNTLSVSNGSWTNAPTSYTRQWVRGASNIAGATTPTYVLAAADVGSTITVKTTAVNAGGNSSVATSVATAAVTAAPPPPPPPGVLVYRHDYSTALGQTTPPHYGWNADWVSGGIQIENQASCTLQVNGVQAGLNSMKFDLPAQGVHARAEAMKKWQVAPGHRAFYGLMVKFPAAWTTPSTWGFANIMQPGFSSLGSGSGLAVVANANSIYVDIMGGQQSLSGSTVVRQYNGTDSGAQGPAPRVVSALQLNVWYELIFEFEFAYDFSGAVGAWYRKLGDEAWTKTVDKPSVPTLMWGYGHTGSRAFGATWTSFHKLGLYAGPSAAARTVQHALYLDGSTFDTIASRMP